VKLRISSPAREDLREIEAYIGKDNPKEAVDFVRRLIERCNDLIQFPGSGRRRDDVRSGYRSVTEGDYLIFYLLPMADVVQIVRVIHAKRDLGKALYD
jgi:toxin ParE1/3/4